jgi:hypothetical protein
MPESAFAKASCLCGAIRYAAKAAPVRMVQCHCDQCQKLSGTGHSSQAFFVDEDVVIQGEPSSYVFTADSGNTKTYHFCPICGSRLHGKNSGRPGITIVPVGCFESNSWFEPQAVAYASCREAWGVTTEEVPNFKTMPSMKG